MNPPLLHAILGVQKSDWMMSSSERLAIVGLLEILKPDRTLEFGYRFGGLTEWLSRYSGHVTTVDIDAHVLGASSRFANVTPLHMTTAEAAARFLANSEHFDFCVIDADHSAPGAEIDLRNALTIAEVILMHDTSNPECRAGYVAALAGADVFADLDLVDGHIQTDGLWGGLGIVVPSISRDAPITFTKGKSNYPLLSRKYHSSSSLPAIKSLLKRTKRLLRL